MKCAFLFSWMFVSTISPPALLCLLSSSSPRTTMWPGRAEKVLSRPGSWRSFLTLPKEPITPTPLPLSESHPSAHSHSHLLRLLACFFSFTLPALGYGRGLLAPDWSLRYRLYVAMSQACSGPAGLDETHQCGSRLLREPYITCRYGRHPAHRSLPLVAF